jgi:multiple sugar transport system permease protein
MATPVPPIPAATRLLPRRVQRVTRARRWFPLLLIAPATLLLALITVLPFLEAVRTSLLNWVVLSIVPPRFVWLQNYRAALTDPLFWSSFEVTLVFVGGVIIFQLTIGFAIALLIDNLPRGQQIIATVIVLPAVLAPMVVGFQWLVLFDGDFGPLNYLLQRIGLPAMAWTGDAHVALPAVMLVDFWESTPFVVLLLYAGLRSLPRPVFEASRVDGARPWQTFWTITVPLLRPAIAIVLILRIIDTFKLFDIIFVLTNGGPGTATENLAYYTYTQGFTYFKYGYATALGIIQMIMVTILAYIILRFMERPIERDPQAGTPRAAVVVPQEKV